MTLLHGFIFAFIQYFHGTILREKSCVKPRGEAGGGVGVGDGVFKEYKNAVWP